MREFLVLLAAVLMLCASVSAQEPSPDVSGEAHLRSATRSLLRGDL